MLQGKFVSGNQKHYPDLGSDTSLVHSFLRHQFPGKPVVFSQNVGCLVRLFVFKMQLILILSNNSLMGKDINYLACEQALAVGREKEGELVTTPLEFEYLH